MRFQTTALLAALALVLAYAERLKIPDERPYISFTFYRGQQHCGGEGGGGGGGAAIASRQLLRGQPCKAQHLYEAMLAAIVSFTLVGAAVVAIVSVGDMGGGGNIDDDDNDKDHKNNTTTKRCMGERGADDDSGNRQLAVATLITIDGNRDRP